MLDITICYGYNSSMTERLQHRQITYRLLPRRQAVWRRLEGLLEAQRQLYNGALEERIDCRRKTGRSISYMDQCKSLTVCRRDLPEMAADPVAIQRGALKRLDEAFQGFFRRARTGGAPGFPRFQGRRRWNSLSVVSGVKLDGDCLRLPGLGRLTVRRRGGNPYPEGLPVSAVLKRCAGKWYAIVCLKGALPEAEDDGSTVGVDMNAGQVAVSDGRLFRAPDVRRLEGRAKRLARKLAGQRKGSKRRERTRLRLTKTNRSIAGARRAWRHRISRVIADGAHTVFVEALRTRDMTASARGTLEKPGSGVRAKAGLNRVILATGWAELRAMLVYKARRVIPVHPAHTSTTCHACGHRDAASRRSQAAFHCVACGHAANADLNAAANIRRRGLTHLHGEERGRQALRRAVKTHGKAAA